MQKYNPVFVSLMQKMGCKLAHVPLGTRLLRQEGGSGWEEPQLLSPNHHHKDTGPRVSIFHLYSRKATITWIFI